MTETTEPELYLRNPLPVRPIGRTALSPTHLTLGTWGLSEGAYGPRDRTELAARVKEALDLGIRSFDVAPLWGDGVAEEVVGTAIKNIRDECTVITRAGAIRKGSDLLRALDGPSIESSVDASRRRLGIDTLDIVLLHEPLEKLLVGGAFAKTLAGLESRGTIRAWGISTTSAETARLALGFGAKVICIPHNLLQPDLVPALLEDVEGFGAGILARSPLLHGLLTEQGTIRTSYPREDHRSLRWNETALAVRRKQAAGFGAAWVQQTRSLAGFALRWALTSPVVSSAIIGPRTKDQLVDLVDSVTPIDHLEPGLYERTAQIAAALGV